MAAWAGCTKTGGWSTAPTAHLMARACPMCNDYGNRIPYNRYVEAFSQLSIAGLIREDAIDGAGVDDQFELARLHLPAGPRALRH